MKEVAMGGMRVNVAVIVLGLVAVVGLIVAYRDYAPMDFTEAKHQARQACEPCYRFAGKLYNATIVKTELLSGHFYALIGLILLLEWAKPVYSKSSALSVAFCHDFLWFFLNASFVSIVLPIYQGVLVRLYDSHLAFLRVDIIKGWPVAGQILIAVLVAGFIRWFHHLLRHKVILFWCFHTVHHSQRDMNPFTDLRVHPIEKLIEASVAFIPFLSLRTDVAVAALSGWFLFGSWYARFYHSNIKTNLGIFRYIMVTPQSHRIHHSRKMEHRDRNFGAIFSIWDHLFGTQYRNYHEYPDTGLEEIGLLQEIQSGWRTSARMFVVQLAYPFEMAFRTATQRLARKATV